MTGEQQNDLVRDRRKGLLRELQAVEGLMLAQCRAEAADTIRRAIAWIDTGEIDEMYDGPGGFA